MRPPCSFCSSQTHAVERCFERMQIDAGGKCPRCSLVGHHWKRCPTARTVTCSFCKTRGHEKDACFHLHKVISNRQNKASRVDSNRSPREPSSNKPPQSVVTPKQPSGISDTGGSIGRTRSDEMRSGHSSNVTKRVPKTENKLDPQVSCEESNADQQATVSIKSDGSMVIRTDVSQLVSVLSMANSLRSTVEAAASDPAQATPVSPIDVASLGALLENALRARVVEKTAPLNDHEQPQFSTMSPEAPLGGVSLDAQSARASVSAQETPSVKSKVVQSPRGSSSRIASAVSSEASSSGAGSTAKQFVPNEPTLSEANYLEQLQLYHNDLWPTFSPFQCPVCSVLVDSFGGVVLKECQVHKTCRGCIKSRILESPFKEATCPQYSECMANITEPEIRELLSEKKDIEAYMSKPLRADAEQDTSGLQPFLLDRDLLPNLDAFECCVCLEEIPPLEGVVPKNCGEHAICKDCLRGAINNSDTALVNCPAVDCEAHLQDREVQMLVSAEEYQALLRKGLKQAISQAMQCKTPDCRGAWFISVEGDGRFSCPECNKLNCSKCEVIHEGEQTCIEYQADLAAKRLNEVSENESSAYLKERLKNGFAMICPICKAIVEKADGCDGVLCTVCKTELCWATKGLRWGPGGKGDWEGGGCRCWVGGEKCAPHCQNCH